MFSSKFLSGANPLNAVSSAVNKFGLFGDDSEGDKKSPPQQGPKQSGQQKPIPGPGKDQQQQQQQQQQQHPHKPGQPPPMQKTQQLPKQGSPQLHGNGQTGPSNKPAGQQTASKTGTQPEVQHKGEPLKNKPIQQSSPKPGDQQQARMQQQSPAKTGAQKQEPAKTGVQKPTKVDPEVGKQQQGSPKMGQQQADSSKVGQEQKGIRVTSQQQPSDKHGPQQQGSKGLGASGMTQAGSSSPGTTKARSQPTAVAKSLCPVCKTAELRKEPPNHKTCTQCKMDVCSLCGFSPPDSDAHEWLCLTCQIQRAQGSSEPPGRTMKNPTPSKISQKQTPSPAEPVKKEMSAPGSPQKILSKSTKVPEMGEAAKGSEGKTKASPAPVQKMTPETQRTSVSPKPQQTHQTERKQSSATPAPQQQSGGLFSFGGSKTETAKTEESVTGKMFGFGSSIFSSASNLIASAVQDEAKTTPPVSPKMQSTKETKPPSVQKSEQDKKQEPQQAKVHPAGQAKVEKVTPKTASTSHTAPTAGQSTCPLCNMGLNMGSKDPPNYNTCTDCKSIVCNQCGFNPMPNVNEGKEWLCLNCQVKRSAGGMEPQIDTSLGKAFKKTTPVQPAPQKANAPGSPQRKASTSAAQPAKTKEPDSQKAVSPSPGQTIQTTQPQQTHITKAAQQESGGLFALGGSKAQPDAAKPVESVTGKMFGFGSSIFSSASTLITSAVQDEPRSTPPVSPKMSAAKESKSPTSRSPLPIKKLQEEKKTEEPQKAKGPLSVQPKADRPLSEPPKKASASPVVSKAGRSACPLCKLELNVGSKDPPNYNTCTECKNTVCNQCGFNPMPNIKEVKEWLCLNCQMQRALGVSEPPGTPMMKLQASPSKVTAHDTALKKETPPVDKLQKKDDVTSAESKLKEISPSNSPQRKPQKPGEPLAKTEDVKGSESQEQASPAFGQKNAQQSQKTGPQKPPDQINQAGIKKGSITSIHRESGGFFGSPLTQPDSAKPPESLGGKMFGFGSSIFSSASTLINSAVQDESKKTPPVSPKMSSASDSKSPTVKKPGQEKTPDQSQKDKGSPSVQPKAGKPPAELPKKISDVPVVSKAGQSTCPICKLELNVGSKDPPNYNTCTECRNTVCDKCGFNPMPNVKEGKVWLCLNCQMQKSVEQSAKPQQSQKTGPQKPPEQKNQQTESLGGKMFGIGTSIFSSASTLINSTVQDESKRTPPVSPKIPASKPSESAFVQKHEQDKKQEQVQQAKTSPLPQAKVEKQQSSPAVPKAGQSTCPLCKMEFNFGSKEPPNYNKCTECKSTVCNQCGFNPMPNVSEVKEWLCLNCQMQRALSASEPTGPPVKQLNRDAKISPSALRQKTAVTNQVETKKEQIKSDASSKVETPVPDTLQKERATLGSPQKSRSTAVVSTSKDAKGPESERRPSPTPGEKKPLDIPVASSHEKPADHVSQPGLRQSKVTPDKQEESGNSVGLSGSKPVTDASKTTESIGGKMFGFGSSIFSSASTLISSAQEESRTTPPGSRKMSAPAQVSPKMSAVPKSSPKSTPTVSPKMSPAREPRTLPQTLDPGKKPDESHQSKDDKAPSQLSKVAKVSEMVPNAGQTTCPLCKAELNIGSKHPPNYNTCTECKNTVCNQCGFNPMPIGEVKEWLCLNCQVKRAVGASELPGPPTLKSQTSPNKAPLPAAMQLKESSKLTTPQTKDSPGPAVLKETSAAVSPQRKQSTPSLKQTSPAPDRKTPQEKVKTGPEKPPDKASQPGRKQSNATAATQQESGGFFGFAGPKPQPEAAKSAESMSGKMLGFSSSIFGSASTLLTSAVRDQSKTTPPVSPKLSPAKEPKSPTVKKLEQEKESGQPEQVKGPPLIQSKAEEIKSPVSQKLEQQNLTEPSQQTKTPPSRQVPSENPKPTAASQAAARPHQSTCPLCKVKLNTSSKDLPNYNTCTECKNTVCNQCGFNPMPNETGAKEWLCLTCQMQRALGETQPPSVTSVNPQAPQKKDVTSPAESKKTSSSQQSPQRKLSVMTQPATPEANVKPEVHKQASPVSSQKIPQKPQKTSGPNKSPDQIRQPERKQSNATAAPQKESGGFFGFGSGKTQPDVEKQAESVTGKVFGFGSSIFSSASTLITSAVQDQPKTPPVSPKMSPAKDIKSPATQEKKKPEQLQQSHTPPLVSAKVDKAPSEPPKTGETTVKPAQPTCPLCKVGLNTGSKDLPNYNVCTECKKTVCNQCGFNPTPNETEMKEWLCLTCQMQRALTATKSVQPPPMKPQASPGKVSAAAAAQKDASEAQKKDIIPTQKTEVLAKNQKESPKPEALPKKMDIVQTPTTANDTPATVSAKAEEEKVSSLPAKDVQAFTASQSKERQLPSQGSPATTNTETSLKMKSDLTPSSFPPPEENSEEDQAETVQKAADQLIMPSDEIQPEQPLNKKSHQVDAGEPHMEKIPKQPQLDRGPSAEQILMDKTPLEFAKPEASQTAPKVSLSTCPLCKVELNIDSKTFPNYNTCTECKTTVCNKCGFSPMPNVTEVKEWLCLNCQMQRALGASEPPGLPLIKPQPSPSKEVPASTQKEDETSQKDVPKPDVPQGDLASIPAAKETVSTVNIEPTKEVTPTAASMPDKTISSTITKTDVSQKPSAEAPKGQPGTPQQQPPKVQPTSKPAAPPDSKAEKTPPQQPSKVQSTSKPAVPPDSKAEKTPLQQSPKVQTTSKPAVPPDSTAEKTPLQQSPKVQTTSKPAVPPDSTAEKTPPQQSPKVQTTSKPAVPPDSTAEKTPPQQPSKVQTTSKPAAPPDSKAEKTPPQQPSKVQTTSKPAAPPDSKAEKTPPQQPSKVQSTSKPAVPPDSKAEKTPLQQSPKVQTTSKPAVPLDSKAEKTPPQQHPKTTTSLTKSALPPDQEAIKPPPQQPPKAATPPTKSAPPPVQPAKQDSGGFFGFGSPKTQPAAAAKSAESVKGKMFGFGSSFLSSASNLITSAVQDEPKTTPPTPRKMSSTTSVTPKSTPPASPKTLPAKDAKPSTVQKTEEKKPEKPQQDKTPSAVKAKVDKAPSEPPKVPTDTQGASKADQSICPLCKVKLTMDSTDPPNYNTCTECKTTVCSQCGFNPVPDESEAKEWLCLNCQMQRALGVSKASEPAGVKPQPMPSKDSTPLPSEQKDMPILVQKEKPGEYTDVQKEATQTTQPKKETLKGEAPVPTAVQRLDTAQQDSVEKSQGQAQDVAGQPKLVGNSPQRQAQTPKPEVKPGLAKQETGKLPQQPSKTTTQPAKPTPPPAQATKQESGGFFGFGASKPTAPKPAESVTGKMFGFGSSILSSASTLITSAVQEEPKVTPPTPRKMSTTTSVSPRPTPPVSPKMPPAKGSKPPATQTSEPLQQAKPTVSAQDKVEKPLQELEKSKEVLQVAPKQGPSNCPLCKVKLNVGTKDPPNYNTCTQCKNTVCNLCGFNPMPHTTVKEWLCLNCQTQRALSGQLGDSGKMPQPSPAPAKSETQATPATKKAEPKAESTKAEPMPGSAKSQPLSVPIEAVPTVPTLKANVESTMATAASTQIKLETTSLPTTEEVSKQPLTTFKVEEVTPKVDAPAIIVTKKVTIDNKEEVPKTDISVRQLYRSEESKPDLSKAEVEAGAAEPSSFPVSDAPAVSTSPVAAEVSVAEVVPETQTKSDLSVPERIIKMVDTDDHTNLTESSKYLEKVKVQPESQEGEEVIATDSKEITVKSTDKITISALESQPVSTSSVIVKDENKEELSKKQKDCLPAVQDLMGNITTTKFQSKPEDHDEEQPQILPISHELNDGTVSDASKDGTGPPILVKEEIKAERRRLSFQAMDESSESELTPSPSPKVQRRRLKVSNISSSSEDIKTESADSSVEDEEFIRRQIMGMGDEEEMSVSEDEKEKNLENVQAIKETELDDTSVTVKTLSRKGSTDNEDSPARKKALPKTDTMTDQSVPETLPRTTFKKAIPVMRQRQSTDEDVESITESVSKGSSSVQASSFTPESSPTSASSLEEDSDSSPSHRKVSGDKQYRKGKHRQPTQPLPTIEDSSEEEKMGAHAQPLSPHKDSSSTEDLKQIIVVGETHRTSGSEYSASIESEPEAVQAVQRGRKPSPTVIPYTPPDPFKDSMTKSLKSAEEAYEEIIQKTKAIPGESPPDIEPLYGGMAIEDYLYESLVEEPEIKMTESQEEPKNDTGSDYVKKLRSPEEVYEEMMQKKRELMMIEHEFQQAQNAMESSASRAAQVTDPTSSTETCVVTIEETSPTEKIEMSLIGIESSSDTSMKKKKRPAPPRPSEPPKRPEVTVVPSTPSGAISFVRPMIPQDPALRKALFPIPDLKITQCSSGEEEDDSLADEYGIGISSDITPSDDSETKEGPCISPPLYETAEMEPICVVCEIPEPKPIPAPISAPELTTTPSPVSPMSPPTSPASPDSSLASNATSSSPFQAQTPISSDSTPLSTPTPPTSFKTHSPPEVSLPATNGAVPSNESSVSSSSPVTVIVTIPDTVSAPSKAQVETSRVKAATLGLMDMSSSAPVVVQMPDLVSSPSQVPINIPAISQASAPSPAPSVVSAHRTALVAAQPVAVLAPTSATVSTSVTLSSCPGPVIVQMPELVSTTAPISTQSPLPVSALVTTPAQAEAKVVHSVPVQSAIPSVSPVVVPPLTQTAQMSSAASTTIVKKKVPPPPPPRSTSVSLPETNTELPFVKTVEHVIQTTSSVGTTASGQPMQSVVVDIQPRMEVMQSDSGTVSQLVTPNRQGHVVIIVPSVENKALLEQTTNQDIPSTGPVSYAASVPYGSQVAPHSALDVSSKDISSLPTKVSVGQEFSAPPLPPKPIVGAKAVATVEVPISDLSPTPPSTLPKPTMYPKPSVITPVTTAKVTPVFVTTSTPSQTTKPPPPIPPKPVSIPAGLVFSHKPGESVKPPPPVTPKAATLPRTKEPPKALSLSLTRPVESKLGATSPKSPVSPRHAKCLQTYVVITLPSEPGSPTEAITVQAPVRRGSIPSTKVSGVRTTPSEQKTPTEAFSAQATVRRASVPTVRLPPPISVASAVTEQMAASEVVVAEVQARTHTVPSVVQPPLPVIDINTLQSAEDTSVQVHTIPIPIKKPFVQQQQSMDPPLLQPKTLSEIIIIPQEPGFLIQPVQATTTEVITVPSVSSGEALVPQTPKPIVPVQPEPLIEVLCTSLQPGVSLDTSVLQDRPAATVLDIQAATEIEMPYKQQDVPTDIIVTEAIPLRLLVPEVSQQIPVEHPLTVAEAVTYSKDQELPTGFNNSWTISEPSPVLTIVTEHLPTWQPLLVAEGVSLTTKSEVPTEVITTDSAVRIPEIAMVHPLPHPAPVITDVTPTPEVAELMPLATDTKMMTLTTAEVTPSPVFIGVGQIVTHPDTSPVTYIPQVCGGITGGITMMAHSVPPLALQPGPEPPTQIITKEPGEIATSIPLSAIQPQVVLGMPVITTEETTHKRRTSISSIVQPPYTTSERFTCPAEYEMPTQVVTAEAFAATRRESRTMQQPYPLAQIVNLPAEKDEPNGGYGFHPPYRRESIPEHQPHVLTYSSEYDRPLDIITTEEYTRRTSLPTVQDVPQGVSAAPVTITKIQQESIESQEIRGAEKVVSSMSHMYSSSISTSSQPPESLPSLVTQVVTTEVQRTTVSVVHERLPQVPPPSVAITIQPDIAKVQPVPKQNGKIIYPGDVIDLRTMKVGIKMTEQGMDLTPPESCRQSFSSDSSGRQITAVQPEIVNLSAAITPATTLSVVTDSITIVTCTATIASYSNTPAEKPLDLQGPVTSLPLPLTTCKPFEPLAQIVYRPVNSQPIVSAVASTAQDIPINLSFEALVSSGGKQTLTSAPAVLSNGGPVLSLEATGAMDLTNYKPVRAMVTLSGTSPGVVTTVVEDDGTPMDLTAGRRSVCCDVIYKLPFTGSCRTQPPVTSQPDNHSGYRPDHYQYDNAGLYVVKGTNGIKASVSETNLTEAGLFSYDPKSDYDYLSGSSDSAIDLTAAKLSAGKALDYTSKATGVYPLMTTAPYSQIPAAGFGVNSALRTSDGIVYSSVAAPVPSTYAITTQPGSIFSTTLTPSSIVHNQPLPHPYGFIPTTDPGQIIPFDTGLSKEFLPTALADIITGYPDMYSDATLEAIAASLDALASSPIFPGLDNTKMAQYQMEREFLELEKLKQLCLAEELEWERQEIQRYREQEQLMVQRELEELQALKQQLLLQQEEEHHAHMVAQQETYAQQKEQLQQIQQLQLQLQRQLDEHYGSSGPTGNLLDAKYAGVGDSGQYWPVKDESTTPSIGTHIEESQDLVKLQADQDIGKKIIDSGVQTDDEDSAEKQHVGRRKKNKRNIDSSAQTDDEDQDEWDAPTKARRRSRKHSSDGKHGSKVSSIAIQTVAEISVQTDHSGTIKRPNVQMDTKVEIIKHISAPENSQKGGSLSCQTDSDRRHTPIEVGYSTHLSADVPSKSKAFYTAVSPLSPEKSLGGRRMLTADPTRFSSGPRILKAGQKSLSDPKSLSPSTEDRMGGYYADSYSGRGSPSSTGKKVKRTLPDPPPEDDSLTGRSGYSTNSARRRLARSTTMARAKILQDIDKELDLVERESSKLRKKQAELDEEEKEIDAKLRYLEMGINRRKEALLKEREKRERAYLQGVAEERDYMSDSEVSNIREARGDGLERPRTAPQSEFDQFIPPQTEADSQYNTLTSPYSHYAQYVPQTQTTSHYTQQNLYQQQSLYHQQVSPYPTMSLSHAQAQPGSYQHALLLQQGKQRQTTLSDLEPKITTNYEVIRNQPLLIVPSSTESGYGVAHLGGKYGNLDLRLGLEERSMASSPMSSISADSFYADIDHHNARNYVLIEDIGELTKSSTGLSNTGLGSGFNLPDKELSKADRLRRTAEVAEFLGSSRLQSYGKGEDDTMEEPYELKLLKQQIKQEFRRGTEGLEHLTGLGLPQYLPSESNFRHFPKGEKYSIGRLTLEKQAAKQLPAAMLYQKQMKNKKALIDPKAITKFSPIQESRDLEPEYGNYMGSGASSVSSLAARARLLQDEITFGLRKNLSEQQKYLGSSLGPNLSGSLNLGQSLGLGSAIRATAHDDGTYPSGTRSRPSSRPSSVYGLDLSIKRDLSSSSLRLKSEGEVLDAAFAPGVARAKPTSLPISQSRGRIPIVAQNSEEESPLSPVGQPMGMARASAGPLPPISADSRDQFGSSHSLPEVQQHMREESRTRGYDRDIAFIMDDLQGAMSDSEAGGPNWNIEAYHLRREDTDWFDKPREGHPQSGSMSDRRQMKLIPYAFPHTRVKLMRDMKDPSVSGNGLGIRVVGGKDIPGSRGEIGAYIAKVIPGGVAEQTGKVVEGMQVLEWNGVPLTGKTYEEVQSIMGQPCAEAELCVRLDLNMLSDPEHPQALEHHVQLKAGGQRSPGVDPKQLAAELQKVSQQQAPGMAGAGVGGLGVLSALERSALLHSGTGSAASSGVPSPGQPASPAISKKQRHKTTDVMKMPHPITGEIQLQINYDKNLGNLIVHVLQARNLAPRDNDGYSDPFVKVYLLPGRGQVMVVQNASADNKRRTKYAQKTMNPEWNQTVIYKNIHLEQLKKKTLEVTVWDYDRSSSNDFLGEVLIDLSNTSQLDNIPRWLPLKEQSESIEHSRVHHAAQGPSGSGSGQGHGQGHMSGSGQGFGLGHSLAPGQGDGSHDSPKNSVIKSRSHGIFPDPAKDMQMMSLEKSHSSPGSSKSSSDGQLRSHGPSRSQSKSSVTQAHLEDAGIAIAAAEAAVQQSCLQPRPGHRLSDVSGSVVLSAPSLVGDAYGGLDSEDGAGTGVDSAIFQVPRIGKTIPNGTDKNQLETAENEAGKTQVMGEIKVALKKEVKTEGDQLVLEILQCRNITYKFKSPDHLPDLYVKLYVVNVATQKRIIKKKTRICRHDREPSFNETFRFPLNPTGHSIQLFLVSNGGKFMKKTLIGEAYIWLDKVDMRKRVVSWHKLFVSSTQTNP